MAVAAACASGTASPQPEVATRKHGRLPDLRALLPFYLHLIGFTASTLLLTWGLFTLLFRALGGFSLHGLMHQLNNLTSRYVRATPERIASFKHLFIAAIGRASCRERVCQYV